MSQVPCSKIFNCALQLVTFDLINDHLFLFWTQACK